MPDTGWIAASSASTRDNGSNSPAWSGATNIYTDNNSYATVSGLRSGSTRSDYLIAWFPAIDIPAYATNIRAAVRVRHKKSGTTYSAASIGGYSYFYGIGVPGLFLLCGADIVRDGWGEQFSFSEVDELFGSDADNWPHVLRAISTSDIAAGVSVELFVMNGNDISTTAYIDQVEVKFWYDATVSVIEVSADIVVGGSFDADGSTVSVTDADVAAVSVVYAEVYVPDELSAELVCSSSVYGEAVYYNPASVTVVEVSAEMYVVATLYALNLRDYVQISVWDNTEGMVAGSIQFDLDSAINIGGFSASMLHNLLESDSSQDLRFAVGLDSEYLTGEFGFFLPSEAELSFVLVPQSGAESVLFRLFRDGCQRVTVTRATDSRVLFRGTLDRESVIFDHQSLSLRATFAAYVDADKGIKSGSNSLDTEFLETIFDYDVSWTGDCIDPSQWMKVRYVFSQLLTAYGAETVAFGNFNRLFTAVVLTTTASTNNTRSAAGWQNEGSQTFVEWLASASPNVLFDRILIYKEMLFQTGDYALIGASGLRDVLQNLAGWFTALAGIDASGAGYVVPTFAQEGVESVSDAEIISCQVQGYMNRVGEIVPIGTVFPGSLNPDPGQCFVVLNGHVTTRRYDVDAVHYDPGNYGSYILYSHAALYPVTLTGDEVLKAYFPIAPLGATISATRVEAFGYSAGDDPVTHDNDLRAVVFVGSETGWNAGGSAGYYIDSDSSFCDAVTERYYEFRCVDREIYVIELDRVDMEMIKLYKLSSSSRYGADVLLRPIKIETNYSKGTTYMEAINVTRY